MAAKKSRKRKSASEHKSHPTPRHTRRATLSSRDKSKPKPRAKTGRARTSVADNKPDSRAKPATKRTGGSLGEAKHKGHWSFRFDAGRRLPRLVDGDGKPMRFSLTPKSWGDILPRTMAAARRIAAKGRRLFKRYRLQQA